MQIGPSLGLAKSSSLESLHNVMHHTIQRDMVDDGSNRSTRNSFKRGVDRSFEDGEQRGVDGEWEGLAKGGSEEWMVNGRGWKGVGGADMGWEQRGVGGVSCCVLVTSPLPPSLPLSLVVDFALDSSSSMPAMISFTKSPHTSKTKKKGFFHMFKKRKTIKKDKSSPENTRKARGTNMEISPASLTSEERDQLMRHYTLQLRPLSHAVGSSSVGMMTGLDLQLPSSSRHSMSALDDYDSPDSPDEVLLASMAKV